MTIPESWFEWIAAGFFFALGWVICSGLIGLIKKML